MANNNRHKKNNVEIGTSIFLDYFLFNFRFYEYLEKLFELKDILFKFYFYSILTLTTHSSYFFSGFIFLDPSYLFKPFASSIFTSLDFIYLVNDSSIDLSKY
jgi:hypothetical protein